LIVRTLKPYYYEKYFYYSIYGRMHNVICSGYLMHYVDIR
jgi:hypothetical protein